jgi:Chlorite dismutase
MGMTNIAASKANPEVAKPERVWFRGSTTPGIWRVQRVAPVIGETLPFTPYLDISRQPPPPSTIWSFSGVASNLRYTSADERGVLTQRQAPLDRKNARCAVLIPILKSPSWWAMAQDERLAIYVRSGHTNIGLDYLPAIARKLYHSRDLGEPFDFLTWFEFDTDDAVLFSKLLARLRATEEWTFVERETEIWLARV